MTENGATVTIALLAVTLDLPPDTVLDAANRAGLVGRRTDLPLTVAAVAAIQRELADDKSLAVGPSSTTRGSDVTQRSTDGDGDPGASENRPHQPTTRRDQS